MDIQANRVHYSDAAAVVRQGHVVFQEPYVSQCIQDSITAGESGLWSLLVDIVPYTKALALARGASEEEAAAEARAAYITGLGQVDVDGFEAEMFWETYEDIEFVKENPYAAAPENPYLDGGAQAQPQTEDVGWGPRNMQRTPGAADL